MANSKNNAVYRKEWYARTKEVRRAYSRAYFRKNWAKNGVYQTRDRAKQLGLEMNLTEEDFIVPDRCPVLGIPIVIGGNRWYDSPSVDRVDNTKGYVKGNVQIISGRANTLKKDATLAELEALVAYVKRCS